MTGKLTVFLQKFFSYSFFPLHYKPSILFHCFDMKCIQNIFCIKPNTQLNKIAKLLQLCSKSILCMYVLYVFKSHLYKWHNVGIILYCNVNMDILQ